MDSQFNLLLKQNGIIYGKPHPKIWTVKSKGEEEINLLSDRCQNANVIFVK